MNGFYNGIQTLVPLKEWRPENAWQAVEPPSPILKLSGDLRSTETSTPGLRRHNPYPAYTSTAYLKEFEEVEQCYLDARDTILPPDIFAYSGIPQGMTQPVFGSYEEIGLQHDVCFERFGRFGPYGYGYNITEGGLELGTQSERNGSEEVWKAQPPIDYRGVDWGLAQKRCAQKNARRFVNQGAASDSTTGDSKKKITKTAMILRAWTGYHWDAKSIMNMRALVSELSLKSGGEYEVFLLLHVKDESLSLIHI